MTILWLTPFLPANRLGGVGLLLMAWDLMPAVSGAHGHPLTLPGVLLVALAHGLNIREIRRGARDS